MLFPVDVVTIFSYPVSKYFNALTSGNSEEVVIGIKQNGVSIELSDISPQKFKIIRTTKGKG